ncbi:MAG: PaaI family thioesterase [Rhizobiaceae bacterium]|nr:PaaI family thioesterase [Rhizobiaceae bacterium]
MSAPASKLAEWLQVETAEEDGCYRLAFAEHHLGNIWIRSLHGGVSGSFIELCAEHEAVKTIETDGQPPLAVFASSSSVDYLRVTKDADLYARCRIVRTSRRLCVVDVVCWQDDETLPVVRGTVTLKIER